DLVAGPQIFVDRLRLGGRLDNDDVHENTRSYRGLGFLGAGRCAAPAPGTWVRRPRLSNGEVAGKGRQGALGRCRRPKSMRVVSYCCRLKAHERPRSRFARAAGFGRTIKALGRVPAKIIQRARAARSPHVSDTSPLPWRSSRPARVSSRSTMRTTAGEAPASR